MSNPIAPFEASTKHGSDIKIIRLVVGSPDLVYVEASAGYRTEVQISALEDTIELQDYLQELRQEMANSTVTPKASQAPEVKPTPIVETNVTILPSTTHQAPLPSREAPPKDQAPEPKVEEVVARVDQAPPPIVLETPVAEAATQAPSIVATNNEVHAPTTVADLIKILGGQSALGRDAGGKSQGHARYWLVSGKIPKKYVPSILANASQRGIKLNLDLLPQS